MTATRPRQPSGPPASTTGRGRIPPHNLQAEAALLGATLLSRDALAASAETGLTADEFYKPAHGHIYDAVITLDRRAEAIDAVTVADELTRAGLLDIVGGLATLITLQSDTPATSNAGRYARIVREMAQLRRLAGVAGEIAEVAYSLPSDVPAAVDAAEALIFAVGETNLADTVVSVDTLLAEGLDYLDTLYQRGDTVTGTPTGFYELDSLLSGLHGGDLVVLGARPAVGKSSFALDIARHIAFDRRQPALVFSLEMSRRQITQRLIAAEARVDLARVRNGRLSETDWPKLSAAVTRMREAPLYLDDKRDVTITELRAKARRLRSRLGGLGVVVVDYVQLMQAEGRNENRQIEVAQISRGLKVLAGELDVPVVALSQISRNVEQRADKRPTLADLRESGALEADADVVILLYRDELYNEASADRGVAEVIVAKQRNGPTGTVKTAFLNHYAHFANMTRI
jgi:replicative DNA helicase